MSGDTVLQTHARPAAACGRHHAEAADMLRALVQVLQPQPGVVRTPLRPGICREALDLPGACWRGDAVAMPSTHDRPPLGGGLRGPDLRRRARLGEIEDPPSALAQRHLVAGALAHLIDGDSVEEDALGLLARIPSRLALLPLEDGSGLRARDDLPGTDARHRTRRWRRLPLHGNESTLQPRPQRVSMGRNGSLA